jgi:hypothetical protein
MIVVTRPFLNDFPVRACGATGFAQVHHLLQSHSKNVSTLLTLRMNFLRSS